MSWDSARAVVPANRRTTVTGDLTGVGVDPVLTPTGLAIHAWRPLMLMSDHERVSTYAVDDAGTWAIAARRNGGLMPVDCTVTGEFART